MISNFKDQVKAIENRFEFLCKEVKFIKLK